MPVNLSIAAKLVLAFVITTVVLAGG